MFIYLIKECKVKVYDVRTKNSIRRVEKKYILSIIIWIVFGMLFTLALGLQWDNIIKAVIGVVLTVDICVAMWWNDNDWKTRSSEMQDRYKNEVINKIIEILKSTNWHLYDRKGIEWCLEMCDIELKKAPCLSTYLNPIKNFVMVILPTFTALGVIILQKVDEINIMLVITFTLFFMLVFLLGLGYIVYPVWEMIFNRKRRFIAAFKEDLQYILAKYQ